MMTPAHLLLALAILTAPESAEAGVTPYSRLAPAIRSAALSLELLDPRETKYTLARVEDFAADVNMLRRRWVDLHDAPWLAESERFPEPDIVRELLAFNRAYRKHVTDQQAVEPLSRWGEFQEVVEETDYLHSVWDAVLDSRQPYYHVNVRRAALSRLRGWVGDERFWSGNLPPHVPLNRFRMVR